MTLRPSRLVVALALLLLTGAPARPAPALLAPLSGGQVLNLPVARGDLPSPSVFIGASLGETFTHHHRVVAYLEALAAASPRVALVPYGETYEGRPLVTAVISTADNIQQLEAIRRDHQRLADPDLLTLAERELLAERTPAVLWLGYGVHGNEPSSTEAAVAAAYLLAAGDREVVGDLHRLIVVLDPLLNPDGRERYLSGYETRRGLRPDPYRASREHREPWPGGRGNHFLFDLNRDWAWATQQETRHRLAAFRSWEPQVAIDFHEMAADSTYFFPPPADPVHPSIAAHGRRWLEVFGKANAAAFDHHGWTYYVGEQYDLFYPAYGDSYPGLRGAVGMTYEMAGGGRAGSALQLPDGRTLGLSDRIARHLITSLASVRTASTHASKLVRDHLAWRLEQAKTPGRTFLWSAHDAEAETLANLLRRHGIRVERLATDSRVEARRVASASPSPTTFRAGAYVVETAQPLGTLAAVLLEREAKMPDGFIAAQRQRVEANLRPDFFDVTAWSLPLAFNLPAWVTDEMLVTRQESSTEGGEGLAGEPQVGFFVPPQGLAGYRLAAALQREGERFRVALDGFELNDRTYPRGTIFVPRQPADESQAPRLDRLATEAHVRIDPAPTSFTSGGIPLGSKRMLAVRPSRIGLVAGDGISPTAFGSLWHLLDEVIVADHTVLDLEVLATVRLADFDVLLLPPGSRFERWLGKSGAERLRAWLDDGGTLVALGGAIEWLASHDLGSMERQSENGAGEDESQRLFEGQLETPGAAVATVMTAHPLTVGVPSPPPVLIVGSRFYSSAGDPQRDLLRARSEDPIVAGFAWPEAEKRIAGGVLMTVEPLGAGRIVCFPEHPAFRHYWRGTTPLLLNALFLGPSL